MVVKNKRGSIPIVTLVVLTLFLTTSTLLLFHLNGKKSSEEVVQSSFLEAVYLKEDFAKYYIYVVASELKQNDSFSKENFIEEFSKIEFSEDYLINLQKIIIEGNFSIDEENFVLDEKSFRIAKVSDKLGVSYVSDLNVNLDKTKEQVYFLNKGISFDDASLDEGTVLA